MFVQERMKKFNMRPELEIEILGVVANAAEAITHMPITKETIQQCRSALDYLDRLLDTAINEARSKSEGSGGSNGS